MKVLNRSFLLPNLVKIQQQQNNQSMQNMQIVYYTDCVFDPIIYNISFNVIDNKYVEMNFSFLLKQIITYPRIIDNIGVLNFCIDGKLIGRLGILITKEKQQIYLSLIE